MKDNNSKVIVIGGGVAGLVAAQELEKRGISPILLESTDKVGGRIKTDYIDGYQFDHGFQVLLTAYPEARNYLNYEALDLCLFDPGAIVNTDKGKTIISDPLRKPGYGFKMLFSAVGNLSDKLKVWKLSNKLKKTAIQDIFQKPGISTLEYLQDFGFSDKMITNFFKPFFRGIFLEKELETSSRMFEFVFKMFSEGNAAIPRGGMQKIPDQLKEQLKKTEIRFNTEVRSIHEKNVELNDNTKLDYDALIVAARPDKMIKGFAGQFSGNRQVTNLYFSIPESTGQPLIELVPGDDQMINNICNMSNVSAEYSTGGKSLISVSLIGIFDDLTDELLVSKVVKELSQLMKLPETSFEYLKTYRIRQALPIVDDLQCQIGAGETKVFDGVYLAGDYQLNGSLNAAMTSGRTAAEAVLGYLGRL